MTIYVDSHAHLDGAEFEADREQVIDRARSAGVHHLMVIGTGATYHEIGAALPIAEQIEGAYSAAGIHPHEAQHFLASDFTELRAMARNPRFRAIGEIGLDYHYDHSPREAQREIFIRQLALARELKLPVLIHCREAWEDARWILDEHWRSSGFGGVLHCFTGSRDEAFALMDAGFMVSFAGNLTFKKSDVLRETARQIPADRLLTETDCPFLAPMPHRGKRNEPAFVVEVLKQLATLRGVSEETLGAQIAENFKQIFP
ncbi:MAG TPA: TatD family hydrolase [Terriglobia bacterium]|nr:TatD family hydrolase [Terriglobia bacterium]